ncbi:MAG: hypothetical protein RLZZ501_1909, partial [Pseudomonadota bacterium]
MKILLIYPPFASTWGLPLGFGEPLGIAYVAAAIEASGRHQVALLDGVGSRGPVSAFRTGQVNWIGLSHEEVLAEIAKIDFDAIGVSACRTSAVDPGIERLIGRIRATHPGVPIIVGGPDASHLWDHYAQNPDIDYVVIGEGEKTMIDLLDALQRADGVTEVKGIAFRGEDGTVIRAPDQDILDIDTLPWPARHLLPMLTYIRHRPTSDLPSATILTSRACPFSCAFCSTIHIWGRKWRGRAAKDVVDEIEFLHRTYGVTEIRIQDDNFCVNRQRVHDICDLILERQLEIRLHIDPGVMFMLADQEMLSKLHRVGVRHLNMQLESGCQTTQAYINKKIDLSHVRAMVTHAHSLGMTIHTNVILGFPFETKAEMIDSVQTAVEIGFDNIDFNYLDPKGDTRVRRDFIAAGLLCPDDHIELP